MSASSVSGVLKLLMIDTDKGMNIKKLSVKIK